MAATANLPSIFCVLLGRVLEDEKKFSLGPQFLNEVFSTFESCTVYSIFNVPCALERSYTVTTPLCGVACKHAWFHSGYDPLVF